MLQMATINGAKALGFDKVGMIKESYKADLIMIDINNENHIPYNDILSSLCFSTYESDIKNVIIDGNIVYRDGKFNNVDRENIMSMTEKQFEDLKAR